MARKIMTVCWGIALLWSGLTTNENALQPRTYINLLAHIQAVAGDVQIEAANYWRNSFVNPCRLFAQKSLQTTSQTISQSSVPNVTPISDENSATPIMDSYWQYYSDCDQWQVEFAAPSKYATQQPNPHQISPVTVVADNRVLNKVLDEKISDGKSNALFISLFEPIASGTRDIYHRWQTRVTPITLRSVSQIQHWKHQAQLAQTPLAQFKLAGTALTEFTFGKIDSENPFRLASSQRRVEPPKIDQSALRNSIADQLDWLGQGCLKLSESLRTFN